MRSIFCFISIIIIFGACKGPEYGAGVPYSEIRNLKLPPVSTSPENSFSVVKYASDHYIEAFATGEVYNFYRQRNFLPAWINGTFSENAKELLDLIGEADREGLNKYRYNYRQLLLHKKKIGNFC